MIAITFYFPLESCVCCSASIDASWSCEEMFKSCDFDVSKYTADLVMELLNVIAQYTMLQD